MLSDRELTGLVFQKHYKNACWFGPFGVILYYLTIILGPIGTIIGWFGLLQFSFFALSELVGLMVRGAAIAVRPNGWGILQLGILLFSTIYYAGLAYLMWLGISK